MAFTKKDKPLLVAALKQAHLAAQAVADTPDGGTCNLDCATFGASGTRKSLILEAAQEAGVSVHVRDWLGRTVFVHVGGGQGARNTAMAEAATAALNAAGLDALTYYQID